MTRPPFFFTSYAVRRADSPLVRRFHERLQEEVEIKRGRSATHEGFLDAGIGLGEGWQRRIGEALGRTRFLVALLSDDYFDRPWCGREWAVMAERIRRAAPDEPVAVLPLFWVPVARELPAEVAALQYRMSSLGAAYQDSCLVDVMRGDPQTYEKFVIELTDHMLQTASVPLPEMDAGTAETFPPAFGLPATQEEQQPTAPTARTADSPDTPLSHTDKRALIEALLRSPVSGSRETYELWLESVRLACKPTQLAPITDTGPLRNRIIALVNFALSRPTSRVLAALADTLEELGNDEATLEVRRLVDRAVAHWAG
jgi:hypothetical protein